MTALRADPRIRWIHGDRGGRRRGRWAALAVALAMSAGLHAAALIALAGRGDAPFAPPMTIELAAADGLALAPPRGAVATPEQPGMRTGEGDVGVLPGLPRIVPPDAFAPVPASSAVDARGGVAMLSIAAPQPAPPVAHLEASILPITQAMPPSADGMPRSRPFASLPVPSNVAPVAGSEMRMGLRGALAPPPPPEPPSPSSRTMPLPAPATGRGTSPVATTDTRPASAAPPRPAAAPPPAGDVVASRPVPAAAVGSEGQAGVAGIGGAGRQADPGDSEAAPAPGNPAPAYPLAARRAQREGRALLRVVVSPDGVGRDIRLAESSGTVALDLAAVEAIRTWRFVPARRAGQATEDVILVPVVFRLTQ
jgi:periplasmic protein TonB